MLDFEKLTFSEMQSYEAAKLLELEGDIRKELCSMRMNVYVAANAQVKQKRGLKKTLARLLTVKSGHRRQTVSKKR